MNEENKNRNLDNLINIEFNIKEKRLNQTISLLQMSKDEREQYFLEQEKRIRLIQNKLKQNDIKIGKDNG